MWTSWRWAELPQSQALYEAEMAGIPMFTLLRNASTMFPTGGSSNPTLNLMMLTLRLAERLRAQMG